MRTIMTGIETRLIKIFENKYRENSDYCKYYPVNLLHDKYFCLLFYKNPIFYSYNI